MVGVDDMVKNQAEDRTKKDEESAAGKSKKKREVDHPPANLAVTQRISRTLN